MGIRLYLITHDEQIFHPRFFQSVLSGNQGAGEITGAAIVKRTRKETTIASLKHLHQMGGIAGVMGVAAHLALKRVKAALGSQEPASVRNVFESWRIPVREIDSPNQPDFVEHLKALQLDVVYCSITNMLKTPILKTPRLGCVNRHSGKLPDYRGAEPVFHALRRRESSLTVTYHSMVEQLDGGTVLWEHAEPVRDRDSVFSLYDRLFQAAAKGFWPAMQSLQEGGIRAVDLKGGAVYKRPTPEEIAEYRKLGRSYI